MTSRELAHATELPDWQQAVGDVVFDWWVAARRLECSTQLCTLLGLSRMPADPLAELNQRIHPDDLSALQLALNACWHSADGWLRHECRVRGGDGQERWMLIRGQLLERDGLGAPRHVRGVFSDISARKADEAMLRRYEHIVATSSDAMYFVDADCRIVLANPAMTTRFGLTPEQVVGRPMATVFGLVVFDELSHDLARALAGEAMHFQRWMHYPALGRRFVDVHYDPCGQAGSPAHGVVVTVRDLTDSARQALLLAQTQRAAHIGGWEIDCQRQEVFWTEEMFCLLGVPAGLPAQTFQQWSSRMPAAQWAQLSAGLADVTAGVRAEFALVVEVGGQDGRTQALALQARGERNSRGEVIRVFGSLQDVTARRQAQAQLRLAASVFESSREAVFITDAERRMLTVNPAFCTLTGLDAVAVVGQSVRCLSSPRHDAMFYRDIWRTAAREGGWHGEVWGVNAEGEDYPQWASLTAVRENDGAISHYIGMFADISARKSAEARVQQLVNFDSLTDLPSRALLQQRLPDMLAGHRYADSILGVLFIDLDRFKNIADTFGHRASDEILRQVATRLQGCIGREDLLCRHGGDEFVLVLANVDHATELARRASLVREALARPMWLDGTELVLTASIGISVFPQDGDNADELLRRADAALHHAKAEGRDNVQFFTESLNARAAEFLQLEHSLRRALGRHEFRLHYQPQIDMRTGQLVGMEALVRWQHPSLGLVAPSKFIPVAEDTGMIVAIGEWVMLEACREAQRWRELGLADVPVAVNLSANQFRAGVRDCVARALAYSGLPANRLELEVTESLVMGAADQVIASLRELKEMGLILSIDDFGTGYSSLSYLKRFPIDRLKIDRSFVCDITTNPDDAAITTAIIHLGHNLRLHVVAEGVETRQQWDFLREQGCDQAQGYWISKPLDSEALLEFLRSWQGGLSS